MTHKEKIIKILNQYIVTENNTCYCNSDAEGIADEILALPLDVPTDEEIAKKIQLFRKNKLDGYGNMSIGRLQLGELEWSNLVLDICKWMRYEIINRNDTK